MLSYIYIAVSVAVGFIVGWLTKRYFADKSLSELTFKLSRVQAVADARVSEEKQRLEAEFLEQSERFENHHGFEMARMQQKLESDLSAVTADLEDITSRYELLRERYSSEKTRWINAFNDWQKERNTLLSQHSAISRDLEIAKTNLDLVEERMHCKNTASDELIESLKNELESVRHSWWLDYHKLNKRNEETILVRDAELERRRQIQLELLLQVRELNAAPEAKSLLCQALEDAVVPDLSHGVVFIKKDLSSGIYHHVQDCTGTGDLILASKVFAEKAGFKACTCCAFVPSPDAGVLVYRSSFSSKTYHRQDCRNMRKGPSFEHVPLPITDALRLGLRPCGHCKPPVEPPFKVFF